MLWCNLEIPAGLQVIVQCQQGKGPPKQNLAQAPPPKKNLGTTLLMYPWKLSKPTSNIPSSYGNVLLFGSDFQHVLLL